jgi:foldase protein PrsA
MLTKRIVIFAVAAVLICAFSLPLAAATMKSTPDVVATVNGEKITKQMLGDTLFDWDATMTLEEMIDQRIVAQEARKAGVVVSLEEIKAKIEEVKTRIPPGQSFEDALKGIGMTPGHYFARVKFQLQMEGILKKQVEVTDEDLSGYIKASHILVRVTYTQDEAERAKKDEEAKAKIEKIAKDIQGGLDFAEAAKANSDDTSNKDKGGDLGFFPKNVMAPEFEEAAFKLKPGEMSGVVKTSFGYHLIKMTKSGKDATADERKELIDKITQQRLGEKWQDWLLSVKNAAKVDNKLAPKKATPPPPPPAPTGEAPAPPSGETPPAPPTN